MFSVTFNDQKFCRGLFESTAAILSEGALIVNEEGITLTAMDLSHICLIHLDIKKNDFKKFEFNADEQYQLGLNFEDFVKILKRSSSNDEISLSHDPKEKKIKVHMKPEKAKKDRTFTMALIDLEGEDINLESLEGMEFPNQCIFDLSYLDEAVKDAEIFAEILQIMVDEELYFSTTGNIGDMEYVLEEEELEECNFKEKSKGIFAISFLKHILKISSIANTVNMSLREEAPVKMVFNILNESKVMYFLAPRVEEDDDSMYNE